MDGNAVQKIIDLAGVKVVAVGDHYYSEKPLHLIGMEPSPEILVCHTLTGVIDYIKAKPDSSKSYLLHIESPTMINLYGEYEPAFGHRKHYVKATYVGAEFEFGAFLGQELFITRLQSCFSPESAERMKKVAGDVFEGGYEHFSDNGVTQRTTKKSGLAELGDKTFENPVNLIPVGTFSEIKDQGMSSFILCRRRSMIGLEFALFQCDGGKWRSETIIKIRDYFREHFTEDELLIVA